MFPLYIMYIMLKDVNDNATFQYIFICFRTKNKFITILIGFVSFWFTIQQIEKDIGAGSLAK